ncbi:cation transporter [Flavivirga spongiicola]|uniref:HMA domain-containing protein n=1 Tax=Flavivirga spongiicola TaxID=421621 RepID=A0ABU7XNA6_9FLAO|nr:cation transporter [Flavivirga sp. MEBiC05379]MDO5981894.1 hypothetical protein [Flavivirga sp. MEBiC05379]
MRRATVLVRNLYCISCANRIKNELLQLEKISSIYMCLRESSISFNYNTANDISTIENYLTFLGYPPKEDRIMNKNNLLCYCQNSKNISLV